MNLLMLSGDSSVARGQQGAFDAMLRYFALYWDRIDILTPAADHAIPRTIHGTVHIHPANLHRALQPYFIRRKAGELLRERHYDLVTSHDYGFFYNGLGAHWLWQDYRLPIVSEIHHIEGYPRAVTLREKAWRAAAGVYVPWASRWVKAFRVVNRIEVPEILKRMGVPPEQILVLPSLYIDFDTFQPLPDVDKAYDLLFVGRLTANKGIFTLLDALRLLSAERPGVSLAMRGSGPLRGRIEQYVKQHNLEQQVIWLPHADTPAELARIYNAARMLVCASTVEGGPRVTVEAMACNVPVISTPVGIMRELIDEGENGLLFQWDAAELAQHIRLLLEDAELRERIAAEGRQSVQGYRAADVIANYARGYHDLIQRLQAESA